MERTEQVNKIVHTIAATDSFQIYLTIDKESGKGRYEIFERDAEGKVYLTRTDSVFTTQSEPNTTPNTII